MQPRRELMEAAPAVILRVGAVTRRVELEIHVVELLVTPLNAKMAGT